MLALTRKTGEEILIGDEDVFIGDFIVKITIMEITGNKVKIGVTAEPDIKIARSELAKRGVACESNQ